MSETINTPNVVRIPEVNTYTYTINVFKFTMTQKVYFKAQNVLSSPIPPGFKDRINYIDFRMHRIELMLTVCLNSYLMFDKLV